ITYYAAVAMLCWLLGSDHSWSFAIEASLVVAGLGYTAFWSAPIGLAYLGLEPSVRRRWPRRIISWNRLLAGRLRDPLVGRDVLIGAAAGVAIAAILDLQYAVPAWCGWPQPHPTPMHVSSFFAPPFRAVYTQLVGIE